MLVHRQKYIYLFRPGVQVGLLKPAKKVVGTFAVKTPLTAEVRFDLNALRDIDRIQSCDLVSVRTVIPEAEMSRQHVKSTVRGDLIVSCVRSKSDGVFTHLPQVEEIHRNLSFAVPGKTKGTRKVENTWDVQNVV